ncbi:hypothetical protein RvY_04644 [Ramazzottius varieornatus]|uniref:Uncharacterized protein n=1 Tax=Ramazzottius varieornatus TaxID=947166 RepID=A0A1D1USY5_RAMVA|nr:hypothetical protein RvY_04644 [Ramazzottius varieornatus]
MTQVPRNNGKELVWDVTVVDTQALTNFAMSTAKAGSAADAAEKRKITKYEDIGSQFEFCPVGLETLGPWGPSATALFEAVGKKMAEVTGEPRSFQFFKQRVSIDIQRDYCYSVLTTVRDTKGLDEVFYVLDVKKGKSV